uniref:ATP-dependent RNA helicase n=1 Tax=Arcella intermedia TaxID=1963864 RepID=A0A6B2L0K8_9EUKA
MRETTYEVLNQFGFNRMTPVQSATLPLFLKHSDVVVEAPTGSGKTLAFVIPIVEKLLSLETPLTKHEVGALIITPTRELAQQIFAVVEKFIEPLGGTLKSILLIGGSDVHHDINRFSDNGANIVVGTPGRLDEILTKVANFNVKELKILVLDEADRLLDMGFHMSLVSILGKLPKQRRTGLFSATQTREVMELVKAGLRNPVKVTITVEEKQVGKQCFPTTLNNFYIQCNSDEKLAQLVHFLEHHPNDKVIVYFLTCACVNFFWKALKSLPSLKKHTFISLHGKVPTQKRAGMLESFSKSTTAVLLTTDLAARGLDFAENPINWIIQYDPPQDPHFFIHRIGRTARMGADGNALLFLQENEKTYIEFLELRKVPIEEIPKENATDVIPLIKQEIRKDRDFLDRSLTAITSYVRAYKEHHCNYIFRIKDLDFNRLLRSFAMLKIPKMPELKNLKLDYEQEDTDNIPFLDPTKEKQRQTKLAALKEKKAETKAKGKNEKQSLKRKKPEPKEQIVDELADEDDDEDMEKEFKLLKKLKKGKITEEQFEEEIGENKTEELIIASATKKKDHFETKNKNQKFKSRRRK